MFHFFYSAVTAVLQDRLCRFVSPQVAILMCSMAKAMSVVTAYTTECVLRGMVITVILSQHVRCTITFLVEGPPPACFMKMVLVLQEYSTETTLNMRGGSPLHRSDLLPGLHHLSPWR